MTLMTRRAPLAARSWNPEARTLEVVISTGAAVERRDARGPFREVLALEGADTSRLVGAPVLDNHRAQSVRDRLGTVIAVRREAGAIVTIVRVSPGADDVVASILAGDITGVSIGYRVAEWREGTAADGTRTRTAVRWTPAEVSFVLTPADPGAVIRAIPPKETLMENETESPPIAPEAPAESNARDVAAMCRAAGLPADFVTRQRALGATDDEILTLARTEVRRLPDVRVTRQAPLDDPQTRAAAMGEALYARHNPAHTPSDLARGYTDHTSVEFARDCLRAAGQSTVGSPAALITRALHTTSDFPLIYGDMTGRELRAGYAAAASGLKPAARQTTVPDFRAKHSLGAGPFPPLTRLLEGGEVARGSVNEEGESFRADTFAQILAVSRQMIVNDDVGFLADMARRAGQSAANTEAQLLTTLLVGAAGVGQTMRDGNALFHASHDNLAAPGTALSDTTVSAARLKVRRQKGIGGEPIDVVPRFLIVPPELEHTADRIVAAIQPTKVSDVNPLAGRLEVLVEPRFTNTTRWYLAADPAAMPSLEHAYLAGAPGPQVETKAGFEVEGLMIKCRLDFGAGFVDWRGWFCNPGA